jgi:hypothetical protein
MGCLDSPVQGVELGLADLRTEVGRGTVAGRGSPGGGVNGLVHFFTRRVLPVTLRRPHTSQSILEGSGRCCIALFEAPRPRGVACGLLPSCSRGPDKNMSSSRRSSPGDPPLVIGTLFRLPGLEQPISHQPPVTPRWGLGVKNKNIQLSR